jgi:Resolvase, N terminal domain
LSSCSRRLPEKVLRSRRVQQLQRDRFPYGQRVTLTPAGIADTDDDPLAPEPANLTGALIGYARVSTSGQILDRQTRALTEAGCLRVFADKLSGKTADRPELVACLDYLRAGDTLVVPSLDRLSRSLQDLITIVPLRPDGKPNRPITMFSLLVVPVDPDRLPSPLPVPAAAAAGPDTTNAELMARIDEIVAAAGGRQGDPAGLGRLTGGSWNMRGSLPLDKDRPRD